MEGQLTPRAPRPTGCLGQEGLEPRISDFARFIILAFCLPLLSMKNLRCTILDAVSPAPRYILHYCSNEAALQHRARNKTTCSYPGFHTSIFKADHKPGKYPDKLAARWRKPPPNSALPSPSTFGAAPSASCSAAELPSTRKAKRSRGGK